MACLLVLISVLFLTVYSQEKMIQNGHGETKAERMRKGT
jgi:hypothetical protein